jgi:hypothetical protein
MGTWEWVALIALVVGFLGLILAIPPFFQMLWGRPHIEVECATRDELLLRVLICNVFNRRVSNWLLVRLLNVRRDSATITASIRITNEETVQIVSRFCHPSTDGDDVKVVNLTLPAGFVPARILIVRAIEDSAITYNENTIIQLRPGTYRLEMVVWAGEENFPGSKLFVVTANGLHSHWVLDDSTIGGEIKMSPQS